MPVQLQYFWVGCPDRMVAIGSIINLVTSFFCDFPYTQFYWRTVYRRFRVRGEGGRPESLTGCDSTVFSVVWNKGYRKSLHAIGTSLFSPRAVCSLIEKAFSSWYRNIPTILSLKSSEYALFQSSSFQTLLLQLDL